MNKGKAFMRRPLAVLIALILLLGLSGCGKAEAEEEGLPSQTDSLVVYAGPYLAKFLNEAVESFSKLYPKVKVDVRDFGDTSDPQNESNYLEVLKSDLAAGAGPDLILFDSFEFDDIYKTAESGTFQDLTEYIANDPDFILDDYNAAVMDAGVINGQRLFVPLSYSMDFLLTTQEALTAAGQQLPVTFEDFCQQMSDYGKAYRDDMGKFFADDYHLFDYILPASGLSILDYTKKEVTADNDDFRSFIDAYKELYDMEWGRSQEGIYAVDPTVYYGESVLLVENGEILYINEPTLYTLVADYAGLLSSQTPLYMAVPSASGKPAATVNMCAAVNSNGENKANAYNLLKIMLSEELQSYGCGNASYIYYFNIPVRNGVLKDCIEEENEFYAGGGVETPFGNFIRASIPDETIDDFVSLVGDVSCSYVNNSVLDFVWSEMQPYFEGQKTYEACLANLENKLELYINE